MQHLETDSLLFFLGFVLTFPSSKLVLFWRPVRVFEATLYEHGFAPSILSTRSLSLSVDEFGLNMPICIINAPLMQFAWLLSCVTTPSLVLPLVELQQKRANFSSASMLSALAFQPACAGAVATRIDFLTHTSYVFYVHPTSCIRAPTSFFQDIHHRKLTCPLK